LDICRQVSVTEARLAAQLGGGPVLFAESPVTGPPASGGGGSGSTAELLVVMPRLVRGVAFTVDYGDGTTAQPLQPTTHTVTVRCRLVHSSVCVCAKDGSRHVNWTELGCYKLTQLDDA